MISIPNLEVTHAEQARFAVQETGKSNCFLSRMGLRGE